MTTHDLTAVERSLVENWIHEPLKPADVREFGWADELPFGLAAMSRCHSATREAFWRLGNAESKDEKVKAVIDYVVAHQKLAVELADRDYRARDIIELIDSETPLDREGRRRIAERLQELLFPKPARRSPRRRFADDLYQLSWADRMKEYLRVWVGLSAEGAEEEVARYFNVDIETMRQRKKRAKREMRKLANSPVEEELIKLMSNYRLRSQALGHPDDLGRPMLPER